MASIGIGSACFHGTLRHVEQQCDETPMVLTLLNWFYELFADTWEHNRLLSAVMPVLLVVYGVVRRSLSSALISKPLRPRQMFGRLSKTLCSTMTRDPT